MLFVKILYGGMSESGLCVFRELCPVSFLVVGECPYVDKNSINYSSSYVLNKQCSSHLEIQSSRIVHPTINTS